MRGPFNGCKSLDISDNVFVDEEKSLSLWISRDTSLRNLNISCLDNKDTVPSILDAVAGMSARLVQSDSKKSFVERCLLWQNSILMYVSIQCLDAVVSVNTCFRDFKGKSRSVNKTKSNEQEMQFSACHDIMYSKL